MSELGRLIMAFRERFNLRKAPAAKALGIAISHLRSFELGMDVHTRLPFRPRDATLRQLAVKMCEYAESKGHPWRIGFEELRDARDRDLVAEPAEAPPPPRLKRPGWSDEEQALVEQARALGVWTTYLDDPAVKALAPAEREWVFDLLRDLIKSGRKAQKALQARESLGAYLLVKPTPKRLHPRDLPVFEAGAGNPRANEGWSDEESNGIT